MKKGLSSLLVLLLVVTTLFVFSNLSIAQDKVIGVSSQWVGNDWNKYLSDTLKEELDKLGYDVIHTNATGSTSQQESDIENLINREVDGIIIAGGEGRAFFEVSKEAEEAGIPLIGVDMILPGAVSGVSADNYTGGTQLGLFMVNKMKGSGDVIILDTPGWQSLRIRKRMATGVFKEFQEINVENEFEVGTSDPVNSAYDTVKGYLRKNPDLKGVLCTWGLPMVGAAKAVKEMDKEDQVVIVSADSDRPVLRAMAEEDAPVMANVGQNPRELGRITADLIDRAIKNDNEELPAVVTGTTYLISNVDPEKDFSNLERITMEECWEEVYYDRDRPF